MTSPTTITLSDGSEWEYDPLRRREERWRKRGMNGRWELPYVLGTTGPLTAADHRAIADVLEPETRRWRDYARHLSGCSTCYRDMEECGMGRLIRAALATEDAR